MLRVVRKVLRFPIGTWKLVRRRPLCTAFLVVVLLGCVGFAGWQYALSEWRAAQRALADDRPAEAQKHLRTCLWVWPRNADTHLAAARAARLTSDMSAAEAHLNRCLELNHGATQQVQLEFLLLRVQTGEMDDLAPALIDLVKKSHPDSRIILETLSRAYIQRLRYKPAYACLSEWVIHLPEDARAYHLRGFVLERLHNEKKAREDYDRALELDPALAPVRLRVVEMLLEDKQAPDAVPHLEILVQAMPDNPMVKARLGMCRFLQGRSDEARELMNGAVDHIPYDPALIVMIAKLALQDGNPDEAERRLRTVLATDPSDTEALFVLGSVLQAQGRTAEAVAAQAEFQNKRAIVERINVLLRDVPDDPRAGAPQLAELGQQFLRIERDKYGIYWLERALEGDPTNQQARLALVEYYERKGNASAAAMHRGLLRTPGPPAPKP